MLTRGHHRVLFGGGAQTLIHVPPRRVSSATVVIEDLSYDEDSDGRTVLASGAATVDSYSATITAAAGRGASDTRLLTHADSAATIGTTYAVQAADGRSEVFVCDAASSTTIRTRSSLSGSYAVGSLVRGVQLSCTFPGALADDETLFDGDPPLRVRWTYTVEGAVWRVDEIVRLVRSQPENRSLAAVEAALRSSWPELVMGLPPHGNSVRDLVESVASRLTAKLESKGVAAERLLLGTSGHELLLQACVLRLADMGHAPATRDAQAFRDEQDQEFGRLWTWIVSGQSAVGAADLDRDTDTAPSGSSQKTRNPIVRG